MNHIAQTTFNRTNLVLLAAVMVAGGVVLFAEGYAGTISLPFALFAVVMTGAAGYFAAFEITTRRLAVLAVIAGAGGYLTQVVGATLGGLWSWPVEPSHSRAVPSPPAVMIRFPATHRAENTRPT